MKSLFSQLNAPFQKADEEAMSLVERGFVLALLVGSVGVFIIFANYAKTKADTGIVCTLRSTTISTSTS